MKKIRMKKILSLLLAGTMLLLMSVSVFAYYDSTSGTRWNSTCTAAFGVYNSNAQAATRIERGSGYPSNVTVELWARVDDNDSSSGCSDSVYETYSFDSSSTSATAKIDAHTGYTSKTVDSIHSIENMANSSDVWHKTFSYPAE